MVIRVIILPGLLAIAQPLLAQVDSVKSPATQIPADRVVVPNLTEAIGGRFAGATMLRADGLSSTGGVLRMRGWRSLVLSNEPALEIDGVLVPVQMMSFGIARTTVVSLLDLVDPDLIDRIEVEPGVIGGIGRGAGMVNGLVRVTTKQGRPGTHFFASSEWGVSSLDLDFGMPATFSPRLGGNGMESCTLAAQAEQACVPGNLMRRNSATDPLVRQTGAGTHGRMRMGVRGTAGPFRYLASGRWSRGHGPLDLPPAERSRLQAVIGDQAERLSRPDRLGELFGLATIAANIGSNLTLTASGQVARQRALTTGLPMSPGSGTLILTGLADPRFPDSAAWVTGQWTPSTYYRMASERQLLRRVASARAVWQPTEHFRAWTQAASVWDESEQRLAGVPTLSSDSLRYRDELRQLDIGFRGAARLGGVQFAISPTYQVRSRAPLMVGNGRTETFAGEILLDASYRVSGTVLQAEVTNRDRSAGVSGVARRDEVHRRHRWEPAIWSYGTRVWWSGDVSGHASYSVAGRRGDMDSFVGPAEIVSPEGELSYFRPEQVEEVEIGLRLGGSGRRWEAGVVGFRQRTTHGWGGQISPPSGGLVSFINEVGARIRNTGLELNASILVLRSTVWQAQIGGVVGLLDSKLESLGSGLPSGGALATCTFEGGQPFARCGRPMPDLVDLNGDGLLSRAEFEAGGPTAYGIRGASIPTRRVGAWFDVAKRAGPGRISVLGHFDYSGGHWSEGIVGKVQCMFGQCRQANDPTATLEEQAAVFQDFEGYFLRDASFGRLRELTLAWQTPGRLARWFGAEQVSLSVTGRNLWTVTGFSFWDPEVRQRAHEYAPFDQEVVPLPRSVTFKVALDW